MLTSALICLINAVLVIDAQGPCNYAAPDGSYKLDWTIEGANIVFNLEAKAEQNSWTGISFGDVMSDLDFVQVVIPYGGDKPVITDATVSGYTPSAISPDGVNAVETRFAQYQNGLLRATFSRPYVGGGNNKNLGSCINWQFPVGGGPISGTGVGKHARTPIPSATPICPLTCTGGGSAPVIALPLVPQPTQAVFPQPGQPRPTSNQLPPLPPLTLPITQVGGVGNCAKPDHADCAVALPQYLTKLPCTALANMASICCQSLARLCPGIGRGGGGANTVQTVFGDYLMK